MSHIYPEIREELTAIEQQFEKMAFETAIEAPAHMRDIILAAIALEPQIPADSEEKEAKIVRMPAPAVSGANPWKWMAAAAVVLLVGIGFLWINATNQSNDLSGQMAELKKDKTKNDQIMTAMTTEQKRLTEIQSVLTESSMKKIIMAGTAKDPNSSVSVMWSNNGKKAVMMAQSITAPPTDMQYQLWAIADGKPVSLGVFDYDEVMKMTEPFEVGMQNISAFAITLEKRGGSPTPTMENMVVIGTVNG